ncbi:MAG TPA: RNA methyltransferase [Mycobacteriales bacterium]|nr:RNA methyltransferase [Mycobacteriales bacterium]
MGEDHPRAARPPRLIEVTSPDDPRLADYRGLTDVRLRTTWEPPHGVFIAESELVIRRALAAGYRPRSMVMAPEWLERMAALIADVEAPVYSAPYDVLRELTGFHVHRGALASFDRKPLPSVDDVVANAHRIVVLEDMVSHTNLGAVFRSAAALGMDAIVLSPSCADPLYRRSIRVSMGEVFAVPYARAESWPGAVDDLRSGGWHVAALTPAAEAVRLDRVQIPDEDRVAMLLGTEGPGLSEAAMSRADLLVRIPMAAGVDSLNVAAAAAIAFWTFGRRPDDAP